MCVSLGSLPHPLVLILVEEDAPLSRTPRRTSLERVGASGPSDAPGSRLAGEGGGAPVRLASEPRARVQNTDASDLKGRWGSSVALGREGASPGPSGRERDFHLPHPPPAPAPPRARTSPRPRRGPGRGRPPRLGEVRGRAAPDHPSRRRGRDPLLGRAPGLPVPRRPPALRDVGPRPRPGRGLTAPRRGREAPRDTPPATPAAAPPRGPGAPVRRTPCPGVARRRPRGPGPLGSRLALSAPRAARGLVGTRRPRPLPDGGPSPEKRGRRRRGGKVEQPEEVTEEQRRAPEPPAGRLAVTLGLGAVARRPSPAPAPSPCPAPPPRSRPAPPTCPLDRPTRASWARTGTREVAFQDKSAKSSLDPQSPSADRLESGPVESGAEAAAQHRDRDPADSSPRSSSAGRRP